MEIDKVDEVCTEDLVGGAVQRSCSTVVHQGCWVGEFTPAGQDITAYKPPRDSAMVMVPLTNPAAVKWIPCAFSPNGEFNFTVTNRRADFEYALFDGG